MNKWWINYPWRLIQTNLRETDFSGLDPERYVESLKEFEATAVLLNASGIIANYNSEIKDTVINPNVKGDPLKEIIDLCHKNNIRVIARTDFSKVRKEIYDKHPDWAVRTYDGDIINYNDNIHICPNSEYNEKVKLDILSETFSRYDFDGLFCNMGGFLSVDYSYNYYGPCYCDNCRRKYREMYGSEMPKVGRELSPDMMKIFKFQGMCLAGQKKKLNEFLNEKFPGLLINEDGYIRTESNTDIGVPYFEYDTSSNCRLTLSKGKLPDNACVDYIGFRYRHSSVSPYQNALRCYQNLASSGNESLYIIGTLDNHQDKSSFEPVKKVFQLHKKYENIYTGAVSKTDTLLIRRKNMSRTDDEGNGLIKVLTQLHIPFDEVNINDLSPAHLTGKKYIVAGDIKQLPPDKKELIDNFAFNGGTVLATGETTGLTCLGIKEVKEIKKNIMSSVIIADEFFSYSSLGHYIPFGNFMVSCEYNDGVIKYNKLAAEHPFGPPELCCVQGITDEPSCTLNCYGKGKGVYVSSRIASFYNQEGHISSLNFFKDVLFNVMGITPVSNACEQIEITKKSYEGKTFIQLVNLTGHFGSSYFKPVPIRCIDIDPGLKTVRSAMTLCGSKVTVKDNKVILEELNDYEGILIEGEE